MRRKQRQIIAMCTILTMLLPLLAGCGSQTTDLHSTDERGAENVMTTESPEEQSIEDTTENATKEAFTSDENVTEEPTEPAENDRFVSDNVIEVALQTDLEHYRIHVEEIRKEGDSYMITGDKIYGGVVVLTVDQKEALDNGALLRLMYEGEEVECIIAGALKTECRFISAKTVSLHIFTAARKLRRMLESDTKRMQSLKLWQRNLITEWVIISMMRWSEWNMI